MYRASAIKSIQTGVIALGAAASAIATITAVNVNSSLLLFHGYNANNASSFPTDSAVKITLTNSTTVTATRNAAQAGAVPVAFTVIEFYPNVVKSCQYGTITLASVGSNTATITSVNTAKSSVVNLGWSSNYGSTWTAQQVVKFTLTNATTITATVDASVGATTIASFLVIEFY